MASLSQRIYWGLPYPAKCWAAAWNARRLDGERFGPEFARVSAEIRAREGWSASQFEAYQDEALRMLVQFCAVQIPFYRDSFKRAGVEPARMRGRADLAAVPILDKNQAREHVRDLVREDIPRGRLIIEHTSGTTGTPLALYRDFADNAAAYAYMEERCHAAAGMRRGRNRSVSLGGHLVTAPGRRDPPFWVYNRRWKQLYMSSYHLSSRNLGAYVTALRKFGGEYIEGYPSSVCAIARYIVQEGLEPICFTACFTTAETLSEDQRDLIRRAFMCRTYNQYGCGEMAIFAADCSLGTLHLSPDYGIVEVLDDDGRPVPMGKTGAIVCTGLTNRTQPFLRYRVGDLGALSPESCSCGSALPALSFLEGRMDSVLQTRDGRLIGRLDPVFKGVNNVMEAQVVQEDWVRFTLRLVPGRDYLASDGERARKNLLERLGGGVDVRTELVSEIERTASGKFKAVVCKLPPSKR